MANKLQPFGFRPVQDRSGSSWCGKTRAVVIAGDDAGTFAQGDLVKFTGDQLEVDGSFYSEITKAAAADVRLAGAIVSLEYDPEGYKSYNPASTGTPRIAYIPQSSDTIYVAQESGNMTPAAAEANVDFAVGPVDTVTGFSTSTINSATPGTAASLPLRLVSYDLAVDNEAGQYALWYVTINDDAYTSKTGLAV